VTVTNDHLTLRGVALRGDRLKRTEELRRGVTFTDDSVTLRTVRDELIGQAALDLNDEGDIVVEAVVPIDQVDKLSGSPYLCVAARLHEDEPADLGFILVTPSSGDALQLPYRLTRVPEGCEGQLRREGYRPVRVVDQATLVELSLNERGQVEPSWDDETTHVEWQHASEIDHVDVSNAIARALGHGSWHQLTESGDEGDVELGRRIFMELNHRRIFMELNHLDLRGRH